MDLATLNTCPAAEFDRIVGPLFEATPGLARHLRALRPFADAAGLKQAAIQVIRSLPEAAQFAYIGAHPELAGAAARLGQMAEHSVDEQEAVRLDRLDTAQQAQFDRNNATYRTKFGFPFIAAVRLHTRDSLLGAFDARLGNSREVERATAIDEICKIVGLRIEALLAS